MRVIFGRTEPFNHPFADISSMTLARCRCCDTPIARVVTVRSRNNPTQYAYAMQMENGWAVRLDRSAAEAFLHRVHASECEHRQAAEAA